MSDQMVADRDTAAVVCNRMLALWQWVRMRSLPLPYSVEANPLQVAIYDGLDEYGRWVAALDAPVSVWVSLNAEDRPVLFVTARAELFQPIGWIRVSTNFPAPHLAPFSKRRASLDEVRRLLTPPVQVDSARAV